MKECEVCQNHYKCELEHKDKVEKCFFVNPTEEHNATFTEEYKYGYNKAIDEFLHNAEVKICDRILQNQANLDFASGLAVANRILDEIAEQMKGE